MSATIIPVENAESTMLDLGDGLSLWFRVWGNPAGTPVLFVHGGPGSCVAFYKDINARFFEADMYRVVEVDQRGTGRSQPSVMDSHLHMQRYLDITIEQMSADFERVREALRIERWLVFGGSWGSCLGLDYALTYPGRCLGLILRGIFLSTPAEFEAIYARKSFAGNARRLGEFDTFFELAALEARRAGEPPLDPDDAERFVRIYERMIVGGDRAAIWRFYAFEHNLIEEDPAALLDPTAIREEEFPKAQSVSFFEARLFLRGTYEAPTRLLGDRLRRLARGEALCEGAPAAAVRTWVVHGTGDEVCPEQFARQLVAGLQDAGVPHTAYFVDAGHACGSDGIAATLKRCVDQFASGGRMASEKAGEGPYDLPFFND